MDHYFDYILNETRYEPDPDDGETFAEADTPAPEEVEAYWAESAPRDSRIPF